MVTKQKLRKKRKRWNFLFGLFRSPYTEINEYAIFFYGCHSACVWYGFSISESHTLFKWQSMKYHLLYFFLFCFVNIAKSNYLFLTSNIISTLLLDLGIWNVSQHKWLLIQYFSYDSLPVWIFSFVKINVATVALFNKCAKKKF